MSQIVSRKADALWGIGSFSSTGLRSLLRHSSALDSGGIPLLSRDEVQTLIRTPHHLKHRLILATLYTTGLRASELCRLQGTDIDSGRIVVIVHQGKSKKDRQVPLSPDLLPQLRGY